MRLFISINPTEEIKTYLVQVQKELQAKELLQAVYVLPDQLHITLVFLGNTEALYLPEIIKKLSQIQEAPFNLTLNNLEINSWHHPRVLWLTVSAPELAQLVEKIETALELAPKHKREFKGHITIARVKQLCNKQALHNFIASNQVPNLNWTVDSFSLVESLTLPQGALYTTIATCNFVQK
jgi:RNA 2',3'-cyclic 3'-phosphodiesterase